MKRFFIIALTIFLMACTTFGMGCFSLDEYENSSDGGDTSISATLGERNALRSAKNYLRVLAFSYEGLIDQLEYEGYSYSEAKFAVDNCGANWYEQAAKKAKEYIDVMSFSKQGLIDQLEYEKFTHEQAVYGAKAVGYD